MKVLNDIADARRLAVTGEGRRIRLEHRVHLREVAAEVGVAHTTVARWESGQVVPRGENARRWVRVMRSLERRVAAA